MKQDLKYEVMDLGEINTTANSDVIELDDAESLGIVAIIDVDTPSAKTFDTGTFEVKTVTFESVANSDAGDFVVLTDGALLTWAISINKTGADPQPTAAAWVAVNAARKVHVDVSADTTAAQVAARIETAFDALTGATAAFTTDDSAANGTMTFTALIPGNLPDATTGNADGSGAGGITVANTTQGVATEVDPTNNSVGIPTHGFTTGLKGQLTTTGTLPAGLSLATDYFIIVVDANNVKFASNLANALAGTAVDITGYGASTSVNTFTPTALAGGSQQFQVSNDNITWANKGSAVSITADANNLIELSPCYYKYARVQFTLTAGQMHPILQVLLKV